MANRTQMIIITSNDNLIQQLSSNKSLNTHIIDLNNNKKITTISKDNNNIINLAFLAELSELNSKSDQVYKRALDLPDDNSSQRVKVSKKMIDSICAVCGDQAIGFNYNVLSCASCKAFFYRNANQNLEKLKCSTDQGRCSLSCGTRRKCPRCRLDRCLAVGMRKDFLLGKEDTRNTSSNSLSTSESANSESLSEIDRLLMDIDQDDDNLFHGDIGFNEMSNVPLGTFSIKDWITIENIRSSFLSNFQYDHPPFFFLDVSDHVTALISWSQLANQVALRFINFFRQIDEFEGLHPDDRFILIKYNLLSVFPISKCLHYDPRNKSSSYGNIEEAERHRQFFMLCGETNDIGEVCMNLVLLLVNATQQDPTVLSLLLTILIFSRGLSMNEDEPLLKDALAVSRVQFYYITLLSKYLIDKHGEVQACRHYTQLMTTIFRIQSATQRFRGFFHDQFITTDTVDRMAPLMQTVLHIS